MSKKIIILAIAIAIGSLILLNNLYNNNVSKAASDTNFDISADWADHFVDLKSMIKETDLIVVGEVVDSIPEKRVNLIFTMQYIKIEECLKGSASKNDVIKVLQTGGEYDGKYTQAFPEIPLWKTGDKMILFLEYAPDDGYTQGGHYNVAGGYQGYGFIKNSVICSDVINSDGEEDSNDKVNDKISNEIAGKTVEEMKTIIGDTLSN